MSCSGNSHAIGLAGALSDPAAPSLVMSGLDPGISFRCFRRRLDEPVDGQVTPGLDPGAGHDGKETRGFHALGYGAPYSSSPTPR